MRIRSQPPAVNARSDATATSQSRPDLPVWGRRSLAPLEDSNIPPAINTGNIRMALQAPTTVTVSRFIASPFPWTHPQRDGPHGTLSAHLAGSASLFGVDDGGAAQARRSRQPRLAALGHW